MPFNDFDLHKIKNTVGKFCKEKTNPALADKVRLDYTIDKQSVIVQEIRPRWNDPTQMMHLDVAKLKFIRSSGKWELYWKRASGKWQRYEPDADKSELQELVDVIAADQHGCFFG